MAYFFLPGSGSESESQPGVLETSNSGASALGAAGFGFAAAGVATAGLADVLDAPAEAAIAAGFAAAGAGRLISTRFGDAAGFAATAGFAAARGFPLASASGLPRPRAYSTEARRSTSMRNGWPDEYSAWNITFHDWQITRRRTIGSCAENWARRQSMVSIPLSSSSVESVENRVEIAQHEPEE